MEKGAASISSSDVPAHVEFFLGESRPKEKNALQEKILRCWESVRNLRSIEPERARSAISAISAYMASPHNESDSIIETISRISGHIILRHPKLSNEEYALLERVNMYAQIQRS